MGGSGHPGGDQDRVLADRLRAVRPRGVPRVEDPVEDWQGDRRQEDGGAALDEVERDGGVLVRAAAAARRGHVQELRGLSRIAFLDGNGVVMLGKIVTAEQKVAVSKK